MKKCSYADKYKAIYPPKCNGGDPCEACTEKWEAAVKKSVEIITSYSDIEELVINCPVCLDKGTLNTRYLPYDGSPEELAKTQMPCPVCASADVFRAETEKLQNALWGCVDWMEAMRRSGDAGDWDWTEESPYTKAMNLIHQNRDK